MTVSVMGSVAHSYDGVTLPSRVDSATPLVRSNPFVAAGVSPIASGEADIKQTSDLDVPELQLKRIGTAVGLVPIGNPRPTQPMLEVSKPNQAKVRVNPLASKPANNFDLPVIGLVEESDTVPNAIKPAATQVKKMAESAQKSRTRFLGLRYVESATPDVLATATVKTEAAIQESTRPAQDLSVEVTEPTETAIASGVEDESAGFSFSFSDFTEYSDAGMDETANIEIPVNEQTVEVVELAEGLLIPPPEDVSFHRDSTELVQAVEDESQSSGDHAVIDLLPLLPSPNPSWTEHPNADLPVAGNGSTVIRYPERRMAHVEVASPPMISFLSESRQDSKTASQVESTRIVSAKLARFRVASAESSPMDSGEQVDEPKPVDPIAAMDAKIRKSYSTARLRISQVKGKMLVRGTCATQEDATEIIRMIRNEFLVPVDDQLVIR